MDSIRGKKKNVDRNSSPESFLKTEIQHCRGFRAKIGWRSAPALEFVL